MSPSLRLVGEEASGARLPPHNLDAEHAVLGSMLFSPDSLAVAGSILDPSDFYSPANAVIFEACLRVAADGHPVDPVIVADHLQRGGDLGHVGGPARLVELLATGAPASAVARHAGLVVEHAHRRQLIAVGLEIADLGWAATDPAVAVNEARAKIDGLVGATQRHARLHRVAEALDAHLDVLEARTAGGHLGLSTGWHDLDLLIGGLADGQLVVIAARPSMGKSAVAAALALHTCAALRRRVLLVSIEMSLTELLDRFVAATGKVSLTRVRNGGLVERDWGRVADAAAKLAGSQLWVLDDPDATVAAIHVAARRVEADLVIVDYLQLMAAPQRRENRQVEVAELSGSLKRMARDLAVPVVALAQLNRSIETRLERRPLLSDLRESGAIENDADVVIGLYRDDYYHPDSADRGVMEMHVLKQRNGPIGVARVAFVGELSLVVNMARGTS